MCISNAGTHGHTHQFSQSGQSRSRSWSITQCHTTDLRERTKTMSSHGDRRGQITDFRDSFERINWLYLLFNCGMKTKTHFEWLLWHWSSLSQLNLEPTRPSGLVGCKVPTDLVKISVKEATHMGFHYVMQILLNLTLNNRNQDYLLTFESIIHEHIYRVKKKECSATQQIPQAIIQQFCTRWIDKLITRNGTPVFKANRFCRSRNDTDRWYFPL